MPIYEYQCIQCSEKFEAHQSMGEGGSKLACPKCRAPYPRRLLSSFFSLGPTKSESSGISCPTRTTGTCGLPLADEE